MSMFGGVPVEQDTPKTGSMFGGVPVEEPKLNIPDMSGIHQTIQKNLAPEPIKEGEAPKIDPQKPSPTSEELMDKALGYPISKVLDKSVFSASINSSCQVLLQILEILLLAKLPLVLTQT